MIHLNNWPNLSSSPHLFFHVMSLLMSRRVAVFDLVLLLQIPPSRISLVHRCVSEGECKTVFCIRFAETGRGFADKRKGHVTAQRDYHKERQEEGGKKKKDRRHKRPSWLVPLHQPCLSTDSWHTNENRL